MAKALSILVLLFGVGCVIWGLFCIWEPLGWIAAGSYIVAVVVYRDRVKTKHKEQESADGEKAAGTN